jgi:protein-tyrosine phosphatase
MIDGNVRVYRSESPDGPLYDMPVGGASISDGKLTIISDNPLKRYYYTVVFNDKYRVKTASRNINICGVQNFRDLGGYKSAATRKSLRWGMIYRSAKLDHLTCSAEKELRNIGIKSIVDLRMPFEVDSTAADHKWAKHVSTPINVPRMMNILQRIENGDVSRDSINDMVKAFNRDAVSPENASAYRKIFDVMLSRDNYPLVIESTTGSGQTGIFLAVLMAALGVDDDVIAHDYCLSNTYYSIAEAQKNGFKLPTNAQEALTIIYTAKEEFLTAAAEEIKTKYGSAADYLLKVVGVSPEEIKTLQEMLLE